MTGDPWYITLEAVVSRTTLSCWLLVAWVMTGCQEGSGELRDAGTTELRETGAKVEAPPEPPRHARPEAISPTQEPGDPTPLPIKAGAMIPIEDGSVLAGSLPGTTGRSPAFEMDDEPLKVGAFEIDALPFPNDPSRPPMTNVTWEKANQLCHDAGKRLCHELEWELACEGIGGRTYPYGARYDETRYQQPQDVSSASGVRALATIGEWTLSVFGGEGEERNEKALRGPPKRDGNPSTRRCAHRGKTAPSTESEAIGFRCCRGAPPKALAYQTPTKVPPWNRRDDLTELEPFQALIRSLPELEELHDDPRPFTQEDMFHVRHISEVSPDTIPQLTWKVLQWIPDVGDELLVATGIDGRDSFVAVMYMLPGGRVRHAASYVLIGDDAPIMLGYTSNPRHVQWLPCVGCRDGGVIEIEDGQVIISQRW